MTPSWTPIAPQGDHPVGRSQFVHGEGTPRAAQSVFERGLPVLGICYGEQTMCAQLGGSVEAAEEREFGRADIEIVADSPLFEGIGGLAISNASG
jgi:GMP synthase (glutamine-hydrolysing)